MNSLQVGDTIDRYTVERVLGSGGTAMVYLAQHNALGTRHALKILTVSSHSIRERLLQEGRVQARLRHPNIVAVTDVLEVDGAPCLLLEFIEGPSLETVLREYRFTMGDGERLFQGIVAGVNAAHEAGIAHRDLKPANVLLAPTEQGFVPKVTDFGLAKVLDRPDINSGNTRAGVAMGTPSYMAPEQIRDAGKVDARADLFSLGCILYELVTRRRAFPGDETLQIYNAVTRGEFIPARHFMPDLPPRIHEAIKGCLQVDASRRIPDCETLLAVLAGERSFRTGVTLSADDETEEIIIPDAPVLASNAPALTLAPTDLTALLDDLPPPMPLTPAPAPMAPARAAERSLWQLGVTALVVFLLFSVLGVGAVFAIGSVVLADRSPVPEPTAVLPVPTPPPPAVVAPRPAPAAAPPVEPAPAAAPPPRAAPSPVPTARPVPPRPRRTPAPAPAPAVAPAPPAVPAAPAQVTVKLLSVPRTASLVIDGRSVGRTPAKLDLAPGAHAVRITSGDDEHAFAIEVLPAPAEQRWCYQFAEAAVLPGSCD
ncbi:MAG: outer membrane biosynthesis protein TonB [Myxococcota bacterium]